MTLTKAQSEQLLEQHGIWITAACDGCGNLLGAVRWTRRGEPNEWCSALCRDGVKAQRMRRRGGRPRKYHGDRERREAHARQQRDFRERLGVMKTPFKTNEPKRVADAILRSGYTPSRTAIPPVLGALR